MSTVLTEKIFMCGNEGAAAESLLHSRAFTSGDRAMRAGMVLAICWLLAAVTFLIPIAHFFLVPLFLIAGPVMAFSKYREETIMEKAVGVCPTCSTQVDVVLEPGDKLPKWTYCPACNKPLQLVYHVDSSTSHS